LLALQQRQYKRAASTMKPTTPTTMTRTMFFYNQFSFGMISGLIGEGGDAIE